MADAAAKGWTAGRDESDKLSWGCGGQGRLLGGSHLTVGVGWVPRSSVDCHWGRGNSTCQGGIGLKWSGHLGNSCRFNVGRVSSVCVHWGGGGAERARDLVMEGHVCLL